MSNAANKRTHPRVQSANLVSYEEFAESDVPEILGMGATMDISEGGIKLRCWQALPVPSVVNLDFALGEDILRVVGRVVHAEEIEPGSYIVGIKFQDITPEEMERLRTYLQAKEEK